MFRLTREIHPIGQGAFYTESFESHNHDTFNVVYDCGSYWDGKAKNYDYAKSENDSHGFSKEIDAYKAKVNNKIDLLFISHFHSDHINGIRRLLKNTSNVKLYMPYLDDNLSLFFFLYNLYDLDNGQGLGEHEDTINWLHNLYYGQFENIKKIFVRESDRHQSGEPVGEDDLHQSGEHIFVDMQSPHKWVYIPVVYIAESFRDVVRDFTKELKKSLPDISNNIIYNVEESWDKIKECITEFNKNRSKNINSNNLSMMLYSGPNRHLHPYYCDVRIKSSIDVPHYGFCDYCDCDKRRVSKNYLAGCLYVGDMEDGSAYQELKDKLKSRMIFNIGLLQISHHGDENDMNNKLLGIDAPYTFCCFGTKNTYHHPEWKTMDMYMRESVVYPIHEKSRSGLVQKIYF